MIKPLQDKIMCDNYICDQQHIFMIDEKEAIPDVCPICEAIEEYKLYNADT